MLFIHHYISSGKLIRLNTANFDRSTILDQILLMKQSYGNTSDHSFDHIILIRDIRAHIELSKSSMI